MSLVYSTSYINFIFFGYPIIQILFGDEYVYTAALQNLVIVFILSPLHTFISWNDRKIEHNEEEDEVELEDGIDKTTVGPIQRIQNDPEQPEQNDQSKQSENQTEEQNQQSSEQRENEYEDPYTDSDTNETGSSPSDKIVVTPHLDETSQHESTLETHETSKSVKNSRFSSKFWVVFFSVVTPNAVCSILGIIWSAINVEMPVFLNDFAYDLEKATMAAGLFTCGVFMWNHPFLGCNPIKLIISLACHFIVLPLISLFWSWLLNVDSKTGMINVLLHTMPTALIGYVMSCNSGHEMKTASFTFFYSILLFLPFLMLWVIVFNELDIFVD